MPDLTNYDGRLEQMALYCEAMLDNLAKLNNAYYDVSNDAYSVSLPNDINMIKFKGVKKLGGRTLAWNQLVDNGTTEVSTINGHKYYTVINGTASIITSDGTAISVVDDTADMVVDLTMCFGAGNEPSIPNEFTEIFPLEHYSYNKGILLSAAVKDVVSKDGNNITLQTYSIPTAIRNLEEYGCSAGNAYNYVDFERKVFVQNVARFDMGTLPWDYSGGRFNCSVLSPNDYPFYHYASNAIADMVCTPYIADTADHVYQKLTDKTIAITFSNGYNYIYLYDTSFTDLNTFKASLNGKYAYIRLATPKEIDISAYLIGDNIANVVSGGKLIFENQHGDGYQIPLPSEVEYIGV